MSGRTPPIPVRLDRPVVGASSWTPAEVYRSAGELARYLTEDPRARGSALVLSFEPEDEDSAERVVTLLSEELDARGAATGEIERPFPFPFAAAAPGSPEVLLVHHAPRLAAIEQEARARLNAGFTLVLTGVAAEWERVRLDFPHRWHSRIGAGDSSGRWRRRAHQVLEETLAADEGAELRELVRVVAAADLWGVPVPFGLLGRVCSSEPSAEGTLVQRSADLGLLQWVELRRPAALLVSTPGEAVAEAWTEPLDLIASELLRLGERFVGEAAPDEPDERWTAIRLIRAWLAAPARRLRLLGEGGGIVWVRAVLERYGRRLAQAATAPAERVGWGVLFADAGLFAEGDSIFRRALAADPSNVRLLHARAYLLARWSETEPGRLGDARRAFRELDERDPGNPYTLQAWGVLEARAGNRPSARRLLDEARRIAAGDAYVLVARADLALDEGRYDEAERLLAEGREGDPTSVWLRHLEGRLRLCQGRWDEARSAFGVILVDDPSSLYARHSLGFLSEAEGLPYEDARAEYDRALAVDPECVPALHALARLANREAEALTGQGSVQPARDTFAEAGRLLGRLLESEPGSPRGLVALASLQLSRAARAPVLNEDPIPLVNAAETAIAELLRRDRDHVQGLHLAGRLAEARGQWARARELYGRVLSLDPGNLHALASLAALSYRTGDAAGAAARLPEAREALAARYARIPVHERAAWERRLADLEILLRGGGEV